MSWPRPIRIVGVGSPLGDDRLGWEAIRNLRERGNLPPDIELHMLEGGQRLLDLLDGPRHALCSWMPWCPTRNQERFIVSNGRICASRPCGQALLTIYGQPRHFSLLRPSGSLRH